MRPDLPVTKVWTEEEWAERMAQCGPPTADDVPITVDGRRIDTREKAIAFLEEQRADADRRAGTATAPDSDRGR